MDWRNAPNKRLGYSPAQLLFGRRTRTLLPMTAQLLDSAVCSPEIREKIIEAKIDQKKYHDRTARDRSREHEKLIEGQTVRVKLTDKNEWRKAQITEKLVHRSFVVKTDDGAIYRRNSKHVRFSSEPPFVFKETSPETTATDKIPSFGEQQPQQLQPPQQQQLPQQQPSPKTQQLQQQSLAAQAETVTTRSGRIVVKPMRYRN